MPHAPTAQAIKSLPIQRLIFSKTLVVELSRYARGIVAGFKQLTVLGRSMPINSPPPSPASPCIWRSKAIARAVEIANRRAWIEQQATVQVDLRGQGHRCGKCQPRTALSSSPVGLCSNAELRPIQIRQQCPPQQSTAAAAPTAASALFRIARTSSIKLRQGPTLRNAQPQRCSKFIPVRAG